MSVGNHIAAAATGLAIAAGTVFGIPAAIEDLKQSRTTIIVCGSVTLPSMEGDLDVPMELSRCTVDGEMGAAPFAIIVPEVVTGSR